MSNKNYCILILFAILLLIVTKGDTEASVQTITAEAPANGPVGWWKFDGDAENSSGNNHGLQNGNPTFEDGVSGNAISFDGEDDYIVVTDNNGSATFEFGTGSFSIAFWIKSSFAGASNSGVEECIICNGTDGTEFNSGGMSPGGRASGKRYVVKFKHNKFRFVVDDDTKHILVEGASDDFATGNWVHVTAVRDTDAQVLKIYCNGQLVSTTVDTSGNISSPGEPLFIGGKWKEDAHSANPASTPVDNYFKGMLDDLQIYDYALSQKEIANIMGLSSIQVSSPLAELLFDVARQYEQAELYSKAENIYQQIIQQYPDSHEANKAQLDVPKTQIQSLFGSGQERVAQAAIDNLITNFSQHSYLPELLYGVAKDYQESDEFERSIAIYQKVVTHFPASDYALMAQTNIILSYISMEKINESQQALNKLFEEFQGHSDFPKAIYEVAEPYKETGELELAEDLYETIVTNYPDIDHAFKSQKKLTVLYIEAGKDTKAQKALDKLIAKFARHPDLLSGLERIAGKYEQAGKYQQAKNIYQKIERDYSGTDIAIQTKMNLAVTSIKQGNDTLALSMLDKLIVDFYDHPLAPEVVYTIGEQYYSKAFQYEDQGLADEVTEEARDCFQKAIDVWEKIVTHLPYSDDVPDTYYFLAICYHKLGEDGKAVECYSNVATDWPDNKYACSAQFMVGRIYENLERKGVVSASEARPKIKAAYEQVLENYPSSPTAKIARNWLNRHSK